MNIYIFIYLKGRITERAGDAEEKQNLFSIGSLSTWSHSQSRPGRSQEPGTSLEYKYLDHFPLLLQAHWQQDRLK